MHDPGGGGALLRDADEAMRIAAEAAGSAAGSSRGVQAHQANAAINGRPASHSGGRDRLGVAATARVVARRVGSSGSTGRWLDCGAMIKRGNESPLVPARLRSEATTSSPLARAAGLTARETAALLLKLSWCGLAAPRPGQRWVRGA